MSVTPAPTGGWALLGDLVDDVGIGPILVAAAVLVLLGLLALGAWRPDRLARLVLWLPAHLLYRIRAHGRENIPATGPALLVSNHVSFIDAFLIFMAQRRAVRFMYWAPYTRVPGLRLLLRWSRGIPIDGSGGPRSILRALRTAGEALARGEVVCVFAEGGITRTGFLLTFQRGLEQILKRSPVPVVPVYLDHVWGSVFSFRGHRFFWKWPQQIPYPVHVRFGKPLPPSVKAYEVREAIQLLSAESAVARAGSRRPVHRQFVRTAARRPFHPCILGDQAAGGKTHRYAEILAGSMIVSRLLRRMLGDDRMVGIWLPPSSGGVVANVAVAFLGKVAVNLNYTSSAEVVGSAIRQCGIRHVITARLFTHAKPFEVPEVELIYLDDLRKRVTTWQRLRAFLAVVALPGFVLERWVLGLGPHKPEDLATVIFSSGSTGDPKGIMLTHGNLAANVESATQAIDPGTEDRFLGALPFFHSFGLTAILWLPLQVGAASVYHADPRQAKEIGDICRKYRATLFVATPTFLRFYMRRCQPGDFASLRLLICGAEKLPPAVAADFKARFGVEPMEGYGCTELSPVVSSNVPDWQQGSARQAGNKPGTIGRPIPGVAVRILDPENLRPLPLGREGMLAVYGANVMKGYLGRPDMTEQVIRDGWYLTGDIARVDEDGFITITDRLSRFSKIAGEMVPHQKIEDELHEILGTGERVCVVTTVPDERRGERLVVLHTQLNGVSRQNLCKGLNNKGLPNLWVPAERDFFEIAEFPVLGTGKLDWKRLKEMALERSRA